MKISRAIKGGLAALILGAGAASAQNTIGPTNVYINNLTNNASITWNWATQNLVQVSGSTGGSVTGTNGSYDLDSDPVFLAVPSNDFFFKAFAGLPAGVNSNLNPLVLNVTTDYLDSVSALFSRSNKVWTIANNAPIGVGTPIPAVGTYTSAYGAPVSAQLQNPLVTNSSNQRIRYRATGPTVTGNNYTTP